MSTCIESRTLTRVNRFRHKEPNQLSYAQFACTSHLPVCTRYVPLSFTLIRHPKIQFFYTDTDRKHTITRSLGCVTLKFCARYLGHLTVEPIGRAAFLIRRSGCISAICLSHSAMSLAAKSLQSWSLQCNELLFFFKMECIGFVLCHVKSVLVLRKHK